MSAADAEALSRRPPLRRGHGTPDEPALDRWARRAAELLDATAGLVSLVDGGRSAAVRGDSSAQDERLLAVGDSLCRRLAAAGSPFVVSDAAADARSRELAALDAVPLGAYAGVPVHDGDGEVAGALCVLSASPRRWTRAEVELLTGLGHAVEGAIALHAAERRAARLDALIGHHRRAHRLLTAGAEVEEVLTGIADYAAAQLPGARAAVVLDGDRVVGTGVPGAWTGAIVHAARDAVERRELVVPPGRPARWAAPVTDATGAPLGALVVAAAGDRAPAPEDLDVLRHAATLAAVAVERDRDVRRLATMATRDRLTGLPNRGWLLDHLADRLGRGRGPVAVLFCDLDRFKLINDTLGHASGDAVLRSAAARLAAAVGERDAVARLGGDEFVVVPAAVHDEPDAAALARRLADALAEPLRDDAGGRHLLRASIGIALVEDVDALEALRRADAAMYEAKRTRRVVAAFDATLDRDRRRELRIAEALPGAAARGELSLALQPIVDLATGAPLGVEALLRWAHPRLGELGPEEFVPIAEDRGLMGPIGDWVLERAATHAVALGRAAGVPLGMAVNLSPRQLADDALPDRVTRVLAAAGVDPQHVTFEVTETALLADDRGTTRVLEALAALGAAVVLDDFGTGFSSLSHLRRLPISGVKLDRSYVAGVGTDAGDTALVSGVLGLAHGLGLVTVAEGVETAAQARAVRDLGCERAQGFHLARPLAERDAAAWLAARAGTGRHAPSAA